MSKFLVFFVFLILFEEGFCFVRLPFLNQRSKKEAPLEKAANSWPDGSYCIFTGNEGRCPLGFQMKNVRLSVPTDYEPEEEGHDGKKAQVFGNFGTSSLSYQSYDNVYRLELVTCCR
ncbi:hypothetical protein FO519_002245 [Halicephalobus sp. NKZ332]|nr:hypothetical protein FO519_002245 [Halicephalobus sp. NKZ332]